MTTIFCKVHTSFLHFASKAPVSCERRPQIVHNFPWKCLCEVQLCESCLAALELSGQQVSHDTVSELSRHSTDESQDFCGTRTAI